jgi:hypothetical protein
MEQRVRYQPANTLDAFTCKYAIGKSTLSWTTKQMAGMKGLSPTQRTLAYLKDNGLIAGIVERWIPNPRLPGGGIRSDLFGFIDIIAISKADGITGIQSCGSDFSGHYRKITEERAEEVTAWLEAGAKLQLIGWRKLKAKRGGKQMVWTPRIVQINLEDLPNAN